VNHVTFYLTFVLGRGLIIQKLNSAENFVEGHQALVDSQFVSLHVLLKYLVLPHLLQLFLECLYLNLLLLTHQVEFVDLEAFVDVVVAESNILFVY